MHQVSQIVQSGRLRSTERRVDHTYQQAARQYSRLRSTETGGPCVPAQLLPASLHWQKTMLKAIMHSQSLFSIFTKRKCEVLWIASENAALETVSQKWQGPIVEGQETMNSPTLSDLNENIAEEAGFEEDSDTSEAFATMSSADNIEPQTELPTCWTSEQGDNFMSLYHRLQIGKGKLGCCVCAKVGRLGLHSEVKGTRFSKEWSQCLITSPFESKTGQQGALPKKMQEHQHTNAHDQAKKILRRAKAKKMKKNIKKQTSNKEDIIDRIFRTAYMIGKEHRPLSDMPVVELQVNNILLIIFYFVMC